VTQHRVLVDIQFAVDDERFGIARLNENPSGDPDVTEAGIRDAVATRLIGAEWAAQGITPTRSVVTTRELTSDGAGYESAFLPAEPNLTPAE
jgi:hypothetical protein